jgi:hypothetical protein
MDDYRDTRYHIHGRLFRENIKLVSDACVSLDDFNDMHDIDKEKICNEIEDLVYTEFNFSSTSIL